MPEQETPQIPSRLPLIATTNLVLFPFMMAPLSVGREASLRALDAALSDDRMGTLILQRESEIEVPTPEQLHPIGCAASFVRMMRMPDGTAQVIVQGLARVRPSNFGNENNIARADVEVLLDATERTPQIEALMQSLLRDFERIVELSPMLPDEAMQAAREQEEPGKLADFVASALNIDLPVRQELLETLEVEARLEARGATDGQRDFGFGTDQPNPIGNAARIG